MKKNKKGIEFSNGGKIILGDDNTSSKGLNLDHWSGGVNLWFTKNMFSRGLDHKDFIEMKLDGIAKELSRSSIFDNIPIRKLIDDYIKKANFDKSQIEEYRLAAIYKNCENIIIYATQYAIDLDSALGKFILPNTTINGIGVSNIFIDDLKNQ